MIRAAALSLLLATSAQADIAAITSQNAGALTLVDTGTRAVLTTVPLPGKPAAVAVDPGRGRVLAIAVETTRLHVFDLTGQPLAEWALGGAPFGIAVTGTGTALVTDWDGLLREIDPETGQETRRWKIGAAPSGVAVSDGVIVTADRDSDAISVIRKDRIDSIPVGHHPFGITLQGGLAYVTNVLSDDVSVVDLAEGRIVATIPTGERPYAVAFAAGRGFVSNQYAASITVFDAQTHAVLAEIETGDYPEGIAATGDGQIVVANWFSDSIAFIDPMTMTVTDEIGMPEGPRAFGLFIAPSAP